MHDMPEFVVEGCNLKRPGSGKMTTYELNLLAYKTVEKFLASTDDKINEGCQKQMSNDPWWYT